MLKSRNLVWLAWLVLAACHRTSTLAEIGRFRISAVDAALRDQVIRVYYPNEERKLGKMQLAEAFRDAQVLIDNGYVLDDKRLAAEAERIDHSTLMPEVLAKIKAIFGDDRESYLRIFVLPTLVARVLHFEFFFQNEKLQAKSRASAQARLQTALAAPNGLEAAAKETGKPLRRFHVSLAGGVKWQLPKAPRQLAARAPEKEAPAPAGIRDHLDREANATVNEEGRRWVEEVARHLRPGQVYDRLVDFGEQWGIVRLRGGGGKDFDFDALTLPKDSFEQWYQASIKRITPYRVD